MKGILGWVQTHFEIDGEGEKVREIWRNDSHNHVCAGMVVEKGPECALYGCELTALIRLDDGRSVRFNSFEHLDGIIDALLDMRGRWASLETIKDKEGDSQ
jgi:hypothetical protein